MIGKQIRVDPFHVDVSCTSPRISRTNGHDCLSINRVSLLFLVLSSTFTHETLGYVAAAIGNWGFFAENHLPAFSVVYTFVLSDLVATISGVYKTRIETPGTGRYGDSLISTPTGDCNCCDGRGKQFRPINASFCNRN